MPPSLPPARAARLAEQARALADPTSLTVRTALAGADELCVCDSAWSAERAENLVSLHLRALRSLGRADRRRDGKMVLYRLTDRGRALLQPRSRTRRGRAGVRRRGLKLPTVGTAAAAPGIDETTYRRLAKRARACRG